MSPTPPAPLPCKLGLWFSGLSGNACTLKPRFGTVSLALLRSEGTWEWANRRVENTANRFSSFQTVSQSSEVIRPLGTLLGPLGCLLLLGKGSYWGPLLPASTNSYSSSKGALSFCLQLIRECHTRLRPQLPRVKRYCSSCGGELEFL